MAVKKKMPDFLKNTYLKAKSKSQPKPTTTKSSSSKSKSRKPSSNSSRKNSFIPPTATSTKPGERVLIEKDVQKAPISTNTPPKTQQKTKINPPTLPQNQNIYDLGYVQKNQNQNLQNKVNNAIIKQQKTSDSYQQIKTNQNTNDNLLNKTTMIQRLSQYEADEETAQEIKDYPEGTTFREIKKDNTTSYQVIIPETERLRFSKTTLSNTEKLPPVLKQIQQFRFGFESSINALAQPVLSRFNKQHTAAFIKGTQMISTGLLGAGIDYFTKRDTSKTYLQSSKYMDQHFVSPVDVAFEPIGWSPKGSTQLASEYPSFIAGGLIGEYGQGLGFSKAGSLVGKGASKGTKVLVKRTIQFQDNIPLLKKAMKPISQTTFGENLYKYSVKGFKPVKTMGKSKTAAIFTKKGDEIVEFTKTGVKKTSGSSFFNGRKFISPEDYAQSLKAVKPIKHIDIAFPKKSVDSPMIFTKSRKIKGVFRKKIVAKDTIRYGKLTQYGKEHFIKPNIDVGDYGKMLDDVGGGVRFSDKITEPYTTRIQKYTGLFGEPQDTLTTKMKLSTDTNSYGKIFGKDIRFEIDNVFKYTEKQVNPKVHVPGTRNTKIFGYEPKIPEVTTNIKKPFGSIVKKSKVDRTFTSFKNKHGSVGTMIDSKPTRYTILGSGEMDEWVRSAKAAKSRWIQKQEKLHPIKSLISKKEASATLTIGRTKLTPTSDLVLSGSKKGYGKAWWFKQPSIKSIPALTNWAGLGTIGLLGTKMSRYQGVIQKQKLSFGEIQNQEAGVIQTQSNNTLRRSISNQDTVGFQDVDVVVKQMTKQDVKTITKQKYNYLRGQEWVQPKIKTVKSDASPAKIRLGIPIKINFDYNIKQNLAALSFDSYLKGYRTRTWKVPEMKDLLGGF